MKLATNSFGEDQTMGGRAGADSLIEAFSSKVFSSGIAEMGSGRGTVSTFGTELMVNGWKETPPRLLSFMYLSDS